MFVPTEYEDEDYIPEELYNTNKVYGVDIATDSATIH